MRANDRSYVLHHGRGQRPGHRGHLSCAWQQRGRQRADRAGQHAGRGGLFEAGRSQVARRQRRHLPPQILFPQAARPHLHHRYVQRLH